MLRFIIGIIFGILVIIFMSQNAETAQISFLSWTLTLSRAVMYLIIYVFGFISGGFIIGIRRSKRREKAGQE